jgi:tetraacyldisaccharide 4'-kinase
MLNRSFHQIRRHLAKQVQEVIHTPDAKINDTGLKKILWCTSHVYGSAAFFRRKMYRKKNRFLKKLPVPVISIGNLAVGGTGKTPMTIYLAKLLRQKHYFPAILSRGYGGALEQKGGIVSNGHSILADSTQAGDEPLMMAKQLADIPLIVGRHRYQSGLKAIDKFGCNLIILDDGFQHLSLFRDLNIVLMDALRPIGNGYLLPRGILREPTSALVDADAVVFTRCPLKKPPLAAEILPLIRRFPLFWAKQDAYIDRVFDGSKKINAPALNNLNGKKVYLFSGIARNDDFHQTIAAAKAQIMGHDIFGDHHRYTKNELDTIIKMAVKTRSDWLLTTEKDFARITTPIQWPLPFAAVGVKVIFPNDAFDQFVLRGCLCLKKAN